MGQMLSLGVTILTLPHNTALYCVVPENIQTPTTEGISVRTPPPTSLDFPFLRGTDDPPTPSEIPQV